MTVRTQIQTLNNKLDKCRRKLDKAKARNDLEVVQQLETEIATVTKQLSSSKGLQSRQNSSKAEALKLMKFNRPLTKAEQADMGKLKKAVKGLVVVHPMTALGKEMALADVTGYAPKPF